MAVPAGCEPGLPGSVQICIIKNHNDTKAKQRHFKYIYNVHTSETHYIVVYCLPLSIWLGWSASSLCGFQRARICWQGSGATLVSQCPFPLHHRHSHHCLSGFLLSWPFLWPVDVSQQRGGKSQPWQQGQHPRSEKEPLVDCNVVRLTFSEASPMCVDVIVDMWIPGCINCCCSSADWWLSDWNA